MIALVLGIVLSSESVFEPSSPPFTVFWLFAYRRLHLENHCLSLVSIALLNTVTQSILGKKGFISFYNSQDAVHH